MIAALLVPETVGAAAVCTGRRRSSQAFVTKGAVMTRRTIELPPGSRACGAEALRSYLSGAGKLWLERIAVVGGPAAGKIGSTESLRLRPRVEC